MLRWRDACVAQWHIADNAATLFVFWFVRFIESFRGLTRSPRSARFHAPQERSHSLAPRERVPDPTQPHATQAHPTHPDPVGPRPIRPITVQPEPTQQDPIQPYPTQADVSLTTSQPNRTHPNPPIHRILPRPSAIRPNPIQSNRTVTWSRGRLVAGVVRSERAGHGRMFTSRGEL